MPMGDDENKDGKLSLLLYGPPKHRKTWWALNAAAAGFNVLILNGDKKDVNIKMQLSKEVRRRLRIINCTDKLTIPVFADFTVRFLCTNQVKWDDTENKTVTGLTKIQPDHSYFVLEARKLTTNDVLVLDSWTKLVTSMMWQFYEENGVDITEAKRTNADRDAYAYCNKLLDVVLTRLAALPCHVIVVAHEQDKDLTKKALDAKGNVIEVPLGEQRTQPISSSKAHSQKLAGQFSDVPYFYMRGQHVYIDTRPAEGRDGGGETLFKDDLWERIQFGDFAKAIGLEAQPDAEMPAALYYGPGEMPTQQVSVSTKPSSGNGKISIGGKKPEQSVKSDQSSDQSEQKVLASSQSNQSVKISLKGKTT